MGGCVYSDLVKEELTFYGSMLPTSIYLLELPTRLVRLIICLSPPLSVLSLCLCPPILLSCSQCRLDFSPPNRLCVVSLLSEACFSANMTVFHFWWSWLALTCKHTSKNKISFKVCELSKQSCFPQQHLLLIRGRLLCCLWYHPTRIFEANFWIRNLCLFYLLLL